jgi:hypothetical protein
VNLLPLPGKPLFTPGNAILLVAGDDADSFCQNPLNPGDLGLIACKDQRVFWSRGADPRPTRFV